MPKKKKIPLQGKDDTDFSKGYTLDYDLDKPIYKEKKNGKQSNS
jgi:hypothetical protein